MKTITVDVFCRDLAIPEEISDHIDSIDYLCDEEKEELFDDICCEGLPIVTEMQQFAFLTCLKEYFAERHPEYEEFEDAVRAFCREGVVNKNRDTVTVCHGIGYNWKDNDLLGGDGSGTTLDDFERFCRERFGISFMFVYYEED